jgi:hypothetical protein
MSQLAWPMARSRTVGAESVDSRWRGLYRAGSLAALVQMACIVTMLTVFFTLGPEPTTAEEYFAVLNGDRLVGLLRLDFGSVINVSLLTVTSFAVYAAVKRDHDLNAALPTALVFVGVALALSTHSAFSMVHLSDRYAAATTDAQRALLLAAGEAVIASDWWNSLGGFMAGIFQQGGAALLMLVALRSRKLGTATCCAGVLCNGLDFLHVIAGLFAPGIAGALLSIGGLFYLAWYPLLCWDLFRLGWGATKQDAKEERS